MGRYVLKSILKITLCCCCCLPTPLTIVWGDFDHPLLVHHPPPSGQQLHHSSGICLQIQVWQCGAYVGAVEEMRCVVCVGVTDGNSGDGCDLAPTLGRYDFRKDDFMCSELSKGATSEAGKYIYRATNVWWRWVQYLLLLLVARYLQTIDVCTWRMLVFMSVVVTVWGFWGSTNILIILHMTVHPIYLFISFVED